MLMMRAGLLWLGKGWQLMLMMLPGSSGGWKWLGS